jgi:predicted phosphodiesterase
LAVVNSVPLSLHDMLPSRMALFADAHGHVDHLEKALAVCRQAGVEQVVLLGDLIDRFDQADACALAMTDFRVSGVFGNHEQELIDALTIGDDLGLRPETIDMFMGLSENIVVERICFCHDGPPAPARNPMDHFFNRASTPVVSPYHIVFSGHTHFRHAFDEHGPLDLATSSIRLRRERRYRINPGALTAGQFAIWDREAGLVKFHTVHP